MPGRVALHGGNEYAAGDELAMDALLESAVEAAGGASRGAAPDATGRRSGLPEVRIVILPVAAARQQPELAGAHGVHAFEEAARRRGVSIRVEAALVLDAASAGSGRWSALMSRADLVHLPGGDPGVVPAVLAGTAAWRAILSMHERGGVVAGASAGAMALCERLWTPDGPAAGLGLVSGIAVMPHYQADRLAAWDARLSTPGGSPTRWLGLDEQTLVIGQPGKGPWRTAGRGAARVVARSGDPDAVIFAAARHGDDLRMD
jgi:cyanophycinase-like exopeptidase